MRIGRCVPPAAAPTDWTDLRQGVTAMLSPGRALRALEEEIRSYFGVRHVFLVSSGTAALALTLGALRSLSRGTEVVLPAYTCFSVPAAVRAAGLRPELCDVDPATFDFDHALLERALNGRTLGVLAHHLFGIPSDVRRVRALCRARGVFVVEDAAQAMGVESNGRRLGTLGDVGIFSLGRGKSLTCGSGGVVVTRSRPIAEAVAAQYRRLPAPRLSETARDLAQFVLMTIFIRPRLYWIPAALPLLRLGETVFPREVRLARLSGTKAALLRGWEERLRRSNEIRARTSSYFSRRLGLRLPCGPSHPYLRLPILAASREQKARLHARSRARGLGLSVAYPAPVNEIPELAAAFEGQRFPSARMLAERLVTIPNHHRLSEEDKEAIVACLRSAAGARSDGWRRAS